MHAICQHYYNSRNLKTVIYFHLKKINGEAIKTRAAARGKLEREERTAMNSGKIRERQSLEYKNMVTDRKLELERLERKIFQSGKMAPPRPDTADDTEQTDEITPVEDQEVVLKEAFDKLKDATGKLYWKNIYIF